MRQSLFRTRIPRKIAEESPPDFITQQNKLLNARIVELEAALDKALNSTIKTPKKVKIPKHLRKPLPRVNNSQAIHAEFLYLGGVLLRNEEHVYLVCSANPRPEPIAAILNDDSEPIVVESLPVEHPKFSALAAIIPPIPEPSPKVLTFKQKIQAGFTTIVEKVFGRRRVF